MLGGSLHFAKITLHFPNLQGGDRFDLDCVRHVHPQKISVRGGSSLFEDTRLNCIFTKRKPTGHQATVAAPCYFCGFRPPRKGAYKVQAGWRHAAFHNRRGSRLISASIGEGRLVRDRWNGPHSRGRVDDLRGHHRATDKNADDRRARDKFDYLGRTSRTAAHKMQ